jgi:hypothetical protein
MLLSVLCVLGQIRYSRTEQDKSCVPSRPFGGSCLCAVVKTTAHKNNKGLRFDQTFFK